MESGRPIILIDDCEREIGSRRIRRENRQRYSWREWIGESQRRGRRPDQDVGQCKRRRSQQLNEGLAGGALMIHAVSAAQNEALGMRHLPCESELRIPIVQSVVAESALVAELSDTRGKRSGVVGWNGEPGESTRRRRIRIGQRIVEVAVAA